VKGEEQIKNNQKVGISSELVSTHLDGQTNFVDTPVMPGIDQTQAFSNRKTQGSNCMAD